MVSASGIFTVLETGPVTVVSFGRDGMPNHFYHPEFRADLVRLIDEHQCEVLAFDLKDVTFIGSGLIGLLTSLRKQGVDLRIDNASPHIRQALEALKLDWLHQEQTVEV